MKNQNVVNVLVHDYLTVVLSFRIRKIGCENVNILQQRRVGSLRKGKRGEAIVKEIEKENVLALRLY